MRSSTVKQALVVDDDEGLCRSLSMALQRQGYTATCANSIQQALEVLGKEDLDLVLLDFELGDGNAFELLDAVRGMHPLPFVVAMSGKVDPPNAFRLRDAGVRVFLPKPIELDDLRKALAKVPEVTPSLELSARESVGHTSFAEAKEHLSREMVQEALSKAGSIRGAAELLGMSRQRLYYILESLGIDRPSKE